MALASESNEGTSSGGKPSKSAKKRKNKAKMALAQAQAQVLETQAYEVEAALDVQLPPGGPGSSWGDPDEPW